MFSSFLTRTVPAKQLCSSLLKVRRLVYNVSPSVCLLTRYGYVTLQEHAVIAVLSLVAVVVLLQCSTLGEKSLSDTRNVTRRLLPRS